MEGGAMDRKVIGGLVNSISRLIHLVACQTGKTPVVKDFRNIVDILKLLKPILDEAFGSPIPSHEQLVKAFEELDETVNEAREFMERLPQRMSKIYSVLQSGPILLKVQRSSIVICQILNKLLQSSSFTTLLSSIQHCMQELQCAELEPVTELIENALKDLRENVIPSLEDIIKIVDTIGLASNQELLMESVALEKERLKLELKQKSEEAVIMNQITDLVNHIRYCVAKLEQFGFINGIPIPSHFRCPLSLQLMLDPVIVASGQTYERSFIQKWLDNGLRVCPKTRQTLVHTELISNYTVNALIASWCEENNIKQCDSVRLDQITNPFLTNISHKDSFSGSSVKYFDRSEQQRHKISSGCVEEITAEMTKLQKSDSLEKKSSHSESESITSVISSIGQSAKLDEKARGEVSFPSSSPLNKEIGFSSWFSPNQVYRCKSENSNNIMNLSSLCSPEFNDLTTSLHVQKLVENLKSQNPEAQTAAASELRLLTKHNTENRVLIAKCCAIVPLVSLLHSTVKTVQENAVTALLNLSIDGNNKVLIAEAGAIEPLIYVLECGTMEAKENSAAALFSLSVLDDYKVKIGRSNAIRALVNLLGSGSPRGRKDASTALFNLSICHENKARMVQAGAVKYLVELMDPSKGMADKSVALLANLSTIPEGRVAITQEGGIPLLVEIVETGSQRGKENAASALLQMCLHNNRFCCLVLQEGAVPPLIALSQFGTPRAKEKAQQILSHFRSQREGLVRKVKT
ncbi:U-box domain-containing protein 3 isoform X1 [Ananas comosus]|uniref:RING-type E3 ubiquitin transferase n=2 Tax=Ananas comosus TaxID=4615 RepID=A0A6P5EDD1_ANACO|nr:U-box domain-containing protein 3 isoform X1 [Ananas comosus]